MKEKNTTTKSSFMFGGFLIALAVFVFAIMFIQSANAPANPASTITYGKGQNGNDNLKVQFANNTGVQGTVELKSHSKVNEIRQVRIGQQVVMWYEFNFNTAEQRGLGNIDFTNKKNNKGETRPYDLVYWNVDHWTLYNSTDIPQGKTIIGLRVNVTTDETTDAVWTIQNKKLDKHAVWTSGALVTYNGNYTVYTFLNNGTFNTSTDIANATLLVIGGGGSGGFSFINDSVNGQNGGAGGGAGGVVYVRNYTVGAGNYSFIVGSGGDFAISNISNNGTNSSAFGYVAVGGGGGASANRSIIVTGPTQTSHIADYLTQWTGGSYTELGGFNYTKNTTTNLVYLRVNKTVNGVANGLTDAWLSSDNFATTQAHATESADGNFFNFTGNTTMNSGVQYSIGINTSGPAVQRSQNTTNYALPTALKYGTYDCTVDPTGTHGSCVSTGWYVDIIEVGEGLATTIYAGYDGGSGGGGAYATTNPMPSIQPTYSSVAGEIINTYGNAGGVYAPAGNSGYAGGGGAGSSGGNGTGNGTGNYGGNGGSGVLININGTTTEYACGGGGSSGGNNNFFGTSTCGGSSTNHFNGLTGQDGLGSGGGGAGFATATTASGGAGGAGVVVLEILNQNLSIHLLNPANDTNFTYTQFPIALQGNVNVSYGVSIVNVSLYINGTINQTITDGHNGLYQFNYTPNVTGYTYWDIKAYGNDLQQYTSNNGPRFIRYVQYKPQQVTQFPDIIMNFSSINITQLTNVFNNSPNNITWTWYNPQTADSKGFIAFITTNGSVYYTFNQYFYANLTGNTTTPQYAYIQSYQTNFTSDVYTTACNNIGCTNGNTFKFIIIYNQSNVTQIKQDNNNWLVVGGNYILGIFPSADGLSLTVKLLICFIVLVFVTGIGLYGLGKLGVEGDTVMYIIGAIDILILVGEIALGYFPWQIALIFIVGFLAIQYLRNRGEPK